MRFTDEDEKSISKFKILFGEEVGKYGLVVFTGGDTYRKEMSRKQKQTVRFNEFIDQLEESQARQKFLDMMKFYKGGWILIDNLEEDKHKMNKQMNELMALIDQISQKNGGLKYNKGIFHAMQNADDKEKFVREEVSKAGCFPGISVVIRYPGENILISQVNDGDQILVMHEDGSIGYDTIYMQGHNDADAIMNAVSVTTSTGQCLIASDGHLIHIANGDKVQTKVMRDVIVGDNILVVYDKSHGYQMTSERVTKKEQTTAHGMYNPMTLSGTIVVNNIIATNYEEHIPPAVAHLMLAPVRGLYRVFPGIVRAVNSYTYRGVPVWAYSVMAVITWITDITARVKCELFPKCIEKGDGGW